MQAQFASISRLLIAAEGRGRAKHVVGVDPHRSGFDFFGEAVGTGNVASPDASRQSVDGLVGLPEQVVVVLESNDGSDGAEDLFLGDPHLIAYAAEDRRS